jgi:16S rRNA processing protein RimM
MNLINIGKVITTQGSKGEVRVMPLTDFPQKILNLKRTYLVQDRKRELKAEVEKAWHHKGFIILKFKGYDTISQAQELKGYFITLSAEERIKLKKDEYYIDDVIGLEVETVGGEKLGKIIDVIRKPGNDIYVVKNGRELWIPATREVVKKVDLTNKKMVVYLLEGLRTL